MDTKKYTIVIDGVQEAIENVKSLKDVIEGVTATVEASVKVDEDAASAKKESASATDELGKVQQKLNSYDAEYATEVARAKAQLKSKNDEVKNALKHEQDLQIIEAASMNTYKEKQTYLSALNRVIRSMTEEEELNGKTKQEWMQISAEVQNSLKEEDSNMQIYTRNVGNYKSALEDVESPTKSLKKELKELKNAMAQMLVDGISPLDEGFQEMAERAGLIKDAIGDAGAEISHFASDTSPMDNVVNVATTATAAYGLLISTMQTFGIENEDVIEGIRKLEAAQTALNSLNTLSASLLDNSTASYKIYHTILQAVGLEKKATAAATTALTAAEGAETVGATAAATATTSFAAALWAVLSPLLVIVAIMGAAVAAVYGLVKAYEALFGPSDEEIAAMEAKTEAMTNLNNATEEHITLLKSQGATEEEVLTTSLQMYEDNLTALEEYVEECADFYGEDSDQYKKAVEEKKKAEEELKTLRLDGMAYLNKVIANYHDNQKKKMLGEVEYAKAKAKEKYEFQVKLLKELAKQTKMAYAEETKMLNELNAAYQQTLKDIENKPTTTTKNKTITRGLGSSQDSAKKRREEYEKTDKELAKSVQNLNNTLNKMYVKRYEDELKLRQKAYNDIEVIDDKTKEEKILKLRALAKEELNILSINHELEMKELQLKEDEEIKKAEKHEKRKLQIQEYYAAIRREKFSQYYNEQDRIIKEYDKQEEDVEKNWGIKKLNNTLEETQNIGKEASNSFTQFFNVFKKFSSYLKSQSISLEKTSKSSKIMYDNLLLTSSVINKTKTSLTDIYDFYEKLIPSVKGNKNIWKDFWTDVVPEKGVFKYAANNFKDDMNKFRDSLSFEMQHVANILKDVYGSDDNNMSFFQTDVIKKYAAGLKEIYDLGEKMKAEGKSETEILEAQKQKYGELGTVMQVMKNSLIEMGNAVGDVKYIYDEWGNLIQVVPADGLSKAEKAFNKFGKTVSKVLNKYINPFKEVFNQMGTTINSVFDAINDLMQAQIDKLADALEDITEKYDDLTTAVENTESSISSLKDEFKSASSSDRIELAKKIADEEALLAQEKAAQQEAYNEQVRLTEEKEALENEQQKKQLSQQQVNAGISLINALINTAEGMTKEYSKGVFGIPTATLIGVLGGIQAAAITAQIAALQAQKSRYAEGGYVNADGMLEGPSHADGGIDIKVGKNKIIEAEGGEFIINRKSSARYYDLLTDINDYGRTGKTISGLNRNTYAKGGSLNFERVNESLSDKQTERQMARAMESVTINPKVSVVDIIRKTNDYNRVRTYAGK